MWIEKQKNGKYKYVEQYEDYMTGKQKRVSVTLEKKTSVAKKTASEILLRMIEDRQTAPPEISSISMGDLISKYLKSQKMVLKASSYNTAYYQCNTIQRLIGQDILVDRITANYLKESLTHAGKGGKYLNNLRTRIITIFRWGYENDYVANISFLKKFKPFKDSSPNKNLEAKYLEPEELHKLLSGFKNSKWELLTRFLSLSGLRIGEAISLNTQDVDLKNHVIHINKTIFPASKEVGTPKTGSSIRDIYIQPELAKVCNEIFLFTKQEALFRGYRTNLFLSNTRGDYISYIVYKDVLKKTALETLGFEVTPHMLRHTHASLLLAHGMSVDSISRRLGHENSLITRQIYLHVTSKLKQQEDEKMNSIRLII